jgi:DNA mismatch endonuclease (patch repair protein)
MARVRSYGTLVELEFRELVRYPCRRGTKQEKNADFVFPDAKVAVFLDGDFWHGRKVRDTLPERWKAKLLRNAQRDRVNRAVLRAEGWTVMSCWESTFKADPRPFLRDVEEVVERRLIDAGR